MQEINFHRAVGFHVLERQQERGRAPAEAALGMEPIIPAGDALDAAVQEIRRAEPTFGFRRVIGVLKDKRPDWQVSEKRVRKCFERTAATSLAAEPDGCLLYTSPSPRDLSTSRMPSSA